MTCGSAQCHILFQPAFVGQSIGFASGLPPGPELAFRPMQQPEFIVDRVVRKDAVGRRERLHHIWTGGSACPTL
jgi:hypothetical protein